MKHSDKRVVTMQAPLWAVKIILETLQLDSQSNAFDSALRDDIRNALDALVIEPELAD